MIELDYRIIVAPNGSPTPESLLHLVQFLPWGPPRSTTNGLVVERLHCTMSNLVYKVTDSVSRNIVILRVYGSNDLFDRQQEILATMVLSEIQLAPRVLLLAKNGRVEEFVHGQTLSSRELTSPKYASLIAREMRRFHYETSLVVQALQRTCILSKRIVEWADRAYVMMSDMLLAAEASGLIPSPPPITTTTTTSSSHPSSITSAGMAESPPSRNHYHHSSSTMDATPPRPKQSTPSRILRAIFPSRSDPKPNRNQASSPPLPRATPQQHHHQHHHQQQHGMDAASIDARFNAAAMAAAQRQFVQQQQQQAHHLGSPSTATTTTTSPPRLAPQPMGSVTTPPRSPITTAAAATPPRSPLSPSGSSRRPWFNFRKSRHDAGGFTSNSPPPSTHKSPNSSSNNPFSSPATMMRPTHPNSHAMSSPPPPPRASQREEDARLSSFRRLYAHLSPAAWIALSALRDHARALSDEISMIESSQQPCFCHCDLQHGNILRLRPPPSSPTSSSPPPTSPPPPPTASPSPRSLRIMFLDFEYSAWAPEAYDVANHWCEYAADYDAARPDSLHWERFPNDVAQRQFIAEYLGLDANDMSVIQHHPQVDLFTKQAKRMVKVSHFVWACWAVLCCRNPNSQSFDYLGYAAQRFHAYLDEWGAERGIVMQTALLTGTSEGVGGGASSMPSPMPSSMPPPSMPSPPAPQQPQSPPPHNYQSHSSQAVPPHRHQPLAEQFAAMTVSSHASHAAASSSSPLARPPAIQTSSDDLDLFHIANTNVHID